jgi:hypothetical protein
MDDRADIRAELLMLSGTVRVCPDCRGERIFVSIDECASDGCEFCCTSCGAAVLVDPVCDAPIVAARVA